ncbi:MAG: adenylate/guanylate cyclase domain-containing protein [Actinomycetota bacterium]|nr:adenylate/guanylate cyclase domain-containing protein [Actinomycetota bacterium]
MHPPTQYARVGREHVAFQVLGDGPVDVLFAAEWTNHVELQWEQPACARFLERLASFSRVILFDRRGTGLSDPTTHDAASGLEPWMDDFTAVLDAAGSKQAAIVATGASGPVALLFAATYPERTQSLVLCNTAARLLADDDYPIGLPPEVVDIAVAWTRENWGKGSLFALGAPSAAGDERAQELHARLQRMSAGPGVAAEVQRMLLHVDVRGIVDTVHVPTLVLHRAGDLMYVPDHGRWLAEHIAGARYVEVPGDDHVYYLGDTDALLGEMAEFLVGNREQVDVDRALFTMVFTDIVGSTERVAELGDTKWRVLLDRHDAVVRKALDRHRGREVNTAGDGFFAVFDGPARAVRCASAIRDDVRDLGLDVKVGVHTGEVETRGRDYAGMGVHVCARVCAIAEPGEVLVTSVVRDLLASSGIALRDRGAATLKGVPGEWQLSAVDAA